MSAYEYRSKAEALMAEYRFLDAGELADELVDEGYILATDRTVVMEEILAHDASAVRSREDFDADCKCGKWLEDEEYEWPDHMGDVLEKWITEAGEADR